MLFGFQIEAEDAIRFTVFVVVLTAMLVWEWKRPRRASGVARALRWPANLALSITNQIVITAAAPLFVVAAALLNEPTAWGLLHAFDLPAATVYLGALVLLDLTLYLQHRLMHAVPWFWRMHRVHHADTHMDATTGIRFHPFEIIVSTFIKIAAVIAIGAPLGAVLLGELLLNASAMFTHGNVEIAPRLDRTLRKLIVTPDMHRVHHSAVADEHNSNFGFNLSIWDRLFRTYREQPMHGHAGMQVGLPIYRAPREARFARLLVQPFTSR